MRQGSTWYIRRERGIGKRFELSFVLDSTCLVVSSTEFNDSPDISYVWVLPSSRGRLQLQWLGHVAVDELVPADGHALDGSIVAAAVQFVEWGITGGQPQPGTEARPGETAGARGALRQGDIVSCDGADYAIVSSPAFNASPRNDVVWGAPIGRAGHTADPERVTSLPKARLAGPAAHVGEEDLAALLGRLRWIAIGPPPGQRPSVRQGDMCRVRQDWTGETQLCLIVSSTQFNDERGNDYVWIMPVSEAGDHVQIEGLTHTSRDKITPAAGTVPGGAVLANAVESVLWGIGGREPLPGTPEDYRQRHQQAIRRGAGFKQGSVVPYAGSHYVVVSGPALNAIPAEGVVWGAPIGRDGLAHPEQITPLPKQELPPYAFKRVRKKDLAKLVGLIQWIVTGEPPG